MKRFPANPGFRNIRAILNFTKGIPLIRITMTSAAPMNPKKMKVSELRLQLESRGLSSNGLKTELIQRLELALDEEEFGSEAQEMEELKVPSPKKTKKPEPKKKAEPEAEAAKKTKAKAPSPVKKAAPVAAEEPAPPPSRRSRRRTKSPFPLLMLLLRSP